MVDPTTVNRSLSQPTRGSDVGTWDVPVNGNFGLLDTITGGVASVAITTGTVTLNAAQLACGTISVTGALVSNAGLIFPAVQGWWSIENLTTNSFGGNSLFVQSVGSTELICLPPGEITDIQINGTTARYRNFSRIGTYWDYAGSTVPGWVSQCTKPPFLNCDGSSFSAGTYPYLNALLGGTTLPDLRGRARFYLNGGTNRITTATSGINGDVVLSAGGDQNTMSHTHGVIGTTGNENANHTHAINGGNAFTVGVSSVGNGPSSPGAAGPAVIISPTTSIESAVHQHAMNFASQVFGAGASQNMPPATISGITMIRAG